MPMLFWMLCNAALIGLAMKPVLAPPPGNTPRYPIAYNFMVGAGVVALATVMRPATDSWIMAFAVLAITGLSPMLADHLMGRGRTPRDPD